MSGFRIYHYLDYPGFHQCHAYNTESLGIKCLHPLKVILLEVAIILNKGKNFWDYLTFSLMTVNRKKLVFWLP